MAQMIGSLAKRWAELRFSIVGSLLASPPGAGQLEAALKALATKQWCQPDDGSLQQFSWRTIETWYYRALSERGNPLDALRKKPRKDRGRQSAISGTLENAIREQYGQHPSWTTQLHVTNLRALAKEERTLGAVPSYPTVRRFFVRNGLIRLARLDEEHATPGQRLAAARLEEREVRTFEAEHVGQLWHLDFHCCSLRVLMPEGEWIKPELLGILDDHSRLACHLQWYRKETTQALAHGFSQAVLKHGIPRAVMEDCGAAINAAEILSGLYHLGIHHEPTLPHSPYQNGKIEAFWKSVEGELLAMLEGVENLTLDLLNRATQAWVERDHNRALHSVTRQAPLDRFLNGPSVMRPATSPEQLRFAFCRTVSRSQRQGDGTLSINNVRFEIPSRYRCLRRVMVRYAQWDLSHVFLVDPETDRSLATLYPIDKAKNASGARRRLAPPSSEPIRPRKSGIAPHLRQLMAEYALSGLPPAYLPINSSNNDQEDEA